jgi:hypothetical protein
MLLGPAPRDDRASCSSRQCPRRACKHDFLAGGLTVADPYRVPKFKIWSAPWVMAGFAGVVHDAADTKQKGRRREGKQQ